MAPPVSGNAPNPNPLSMRDPQPLEPKPRPAQGVPPPSTYVPKQADTFEPAPPKGPATGLYLAQGSLSATAQHKDLDPDLRDKIDPKVWQKLPVGQRSTLISTYLTLQAAGAWGDVARVTGEKEQRERPVKVGGYETQVAGNSGAIAFELKMPNTFAATLQKANPAFGKDGGVMGALHQGQTSYRQSGDQPTSVHISIGPGNKMDAHIDQVNPVNAPDAHGNTQMNLKKGIEHWSREVLPEMIRKTYGVPGVIVAPTLTPGSKENPKAEAKIMVGFEFKGFSKSKPYLENTPRDGSYAIPDQAIENLSKNETLAKMQFPYPKGLTRDSAPDPRELAISVAMLAKEALEKGEPRIHLDLPSYAGQPGYQKAATAEIARITKIAVAELKAQGIDTSSLSAITVTYGKKNAKDRFATEGETVGL